MLAAFFQVIWTFVCPFFLLETTQAQFWQCSEEVTLTSAGEPRAMADKVFSVRSLFCYTEITTFSIFFPSRRAPVCIIIG